MKCALSVLISVAFPALKYFCTLPHKQHDLKKVKKKVKVTLVQTLGLCTGSTAHRGSRGIALLFHDHGTRRGEGSALRSDRSLPPGKIRYPLYRRLFGAQGRSGHMRKTSPPPGFGPRTVQPVASGYTDCATRPTKKVDTEHKIVFSFSLQFFSGTILIVIQIERDIIKNVYRSSCKIPVTRVRL